MYMDLIYSSSDTRHNLFRYWLSKQFNYNNNIQGGSGTKAKWHTLSHNGVLFPPEYIPHQTPIIYAGNKIILNPEAEEFATIWAKYLDSEYMKSSVFKRNFWHDWKKLLNTDTKIESLDSCDFSLINKYIIDKLANKTKLSDEDKATKDSNELKYKTAIVDGKEQPVGNFRVEPPGIFIGRGCNPKLGRLKRRIEPEDIIINIGKDAVVPSPPDGHKWRKVIHDNSVEWLASWDDEITGKIKYVWLGAHSDNKALKDMKKFDLARKLKRNIKKIREQNEIELVSPDIKNRQIATALYFIDNYALRVGNEKGEDETDTVGITSLRVEHIELMDNLIAKLDFLSKDSVRYNRALPVSEKVYLNLIAFIENKDPGDQLFDKISSNDINKYLQTFMPGLTAKVFRTYNASSVFQKELKKIKKRYDQSTSINILLDEYNKANAKVALLCNHQKNINKNTNDQIKNLDTMIKAAKKEIKSQTITDSKKLRLKEKIKKLKTKKDLKIALKNISLGTSKINYIDPRISVSFIKKYGIPFEKVFSGSLREKFKWAMDVDENYKF